jgi:2-keto-4-pentenoate hydratase/2-oxohepta-3-ene-1,7-dioic acid hydratase in catechol pathway
MCVHRHHGRDLRTGDILRTGTVSGDHAGREGASGIVRRVAEALVAG